MKKIVYCSQFVDSLVNNEDSRNVIKNEIINLVPNEKIRVADLGCGNGRFVDYILDSKNIQSVLFLDEKAELIENCRRKYKTSNFEKEYIVGDFSELQKNRKKFDVVLAGFSIGVQFRKKFSEKFYQKFKTNIEQSLAFNGRFILVEYEGFCFEDGSNAKIVAGDEELAKFETRLRKDKNFHCHSIHSEMEYPIQKKDIRKVLPANWLPSFNDIINPRLVEYKANGKTYTKLPTQYLIAIYDKQ